MIPLWVAVASHAAGIWWLVRLGTERSVSGANHRVAKDWDTLSQYSGDTVALAKALAGLDGLSVLDEKSFSTFVNDVASARRMLDRIFSKKNELRQRFGTDQHLEEEIRIALTQHAVITLNKKTESKDERLRNILSALYLIGRAGYISVKTSDLETLRKEMIQLCRDLGERTLAHACEELQTKTARTFLTALEQSRHVQELGEEADLRHIVHVFMPLSLGAELKHTGLVDELVRRYAPKE